MRTSDRFDTWATRALGFRGNLCSFNVRCQGHVPRMAGFWGCPLPREGSWIPRSPQREQSWKVRLRDLKGFFPGRQVPPRNVKVTSTFSSIPLHSRELQLLGGTPPPPVYACLWCSFIRSFIHLRIHIVWQPPLSQVGNGLDCQWARTLPWVTRCWDSPSGWDPIEGCSLRPWGGSTARSSYPLSQEKPEPWDKA